MSDVELLKQKLTEWHTWLSGGDANAINEQIHRLLWNTALYRCINESRKYHDKNNRDELIANGSLHEMIDSGYITMHAIGIRRLIEPGTTTGKRGIYSLSGLIIDIQRNAELLTRKNMLLTRELVYDYQPIEDRSHEAAYKESKANGVRASFISGEGWAESKCWHGLIDDLCDVSSSQRHQDDSPDKSKFDLLLNSLSQAGQQVKDYTDKFIAHAATPDSRNAIASEELPLSLAKLWQAEKSIVRVANFLSLHIVEGHILGGVAVPQFDQFEHLDRPFVTKAALVAMEETWDQYCHEIQECESWHWNKPLPMNNE
ncbi:MAG: hypothetical protein IT445_18200 [Phycisphaeraceae bacterium]|nr:hypothetical protein [Phycisphaeraceae bacterium]